MQQLVASGDIVAGAQVISAAAGRVVTIAAASPTLAVGTALSAAADQGAVSVLLGRWGGLKRAAAASTLGGLRRGGRRDPHAVRADATLSVLRENSVVSKGHLDELGVPSVKLARVTTDLLAAGFPTLLGFLIGLLSRNRFGGRAERLYDLAAKMPADSPMRKQYEMAAEEAAKRTLRGIRYLPLRVRLPLFYLLGWLLYIALARIGAAILPTFGSVGTEWAGRLESGGLSPQAATALGFSLTAFWLLAFLAFLALLAQAVFWLVTLVATSVMPFVQSRWRHPELAPGFRLMVVVILGILLLPAVFVVRSLLKLL